MLFILTGCVISWYNTHASKVKAVLSSFLEIVPTSDLFLARFELEMGFLLRSTVRRPKYRSKPFEALKLKKRATLILAIAGFTFREIASLLHISTNTVNRWLKECYNNLGNNIPDTVRNDKN